MRIKITILIIFFILIYIVNINNDNNTNRVMNVIYTNNIDENSFNDYLVYFDSYNLNTHNFINVLSYFKVYNCEFNIIRLYPYYNSMYETIFNNKSFIYYSSDLDYILNKFTEEYQMLFNSNNYELNVSGISIQRLVINTSNGCIINFLNNYKLNKYTVIK